MFLGINLEEVAQAIEISCKSIIALFIAMFLLYVFILILSKVKISKKK